MKLVHRVSVAAIGAVSVLGVAAPAIAQTDIPYTWNNSSDQDAKGKFESYGEHVYAYEYEGNDYIDYSFGSNTGLRWYIPGSEDKNRHDLNLEINEGVVFKMQVCEDKNLAPDDCSSWKSGVA